LYSITQIPLWYKDKIFDVFFAAYPAIRFSTLFAATALYALAGIPAVYSPKPTMPGCKFRWLPLLSGAGIGIIGISL